MNFHPIALRKHWLQTRRKKATRRIIQKVEEIVTISRETGMFPVLAETTREERDFAIKVIGIRRGEIQITRYILWGLIALIGLTLKMWG